VLKKEFKQLTEILGEKESDLTKFVERSKSVFAANFLRTVKKEYSDNPSLYNKFVAVVRAARAERVNSVVFFERVHSLLIDKPHLVQSLKYILAEGLAPPNIESDAPVEEISTDMFFGLKNVSVFDDLTFLSPSKHSDILKPEESILNCDVCRLPCEESFLSCSRCACRVHQLCCDDFSTSKLFVSASYKFYFLCHSCKAIVLSNEVETHLGVGENALAVLNKVSSIQRLRLHLANDDRQDKETRYKAQISQVNNFSYKFQLL
jgi:hypothetical protein